MITVTLHKKSGVVARVVAEGHSGLAKSGSDVLCAAVSALVQTAFLAIESMAGGAKYERDDEAGYFAFDVPAADDRHDIDVVLNAMCIGLNDLASGYPKNIRLEEA